MGAVAWRQHCRMVSHTLMKSLNLFLMLMIWPATIQAENLGFFGEIHGGEYPQFDWLESDFKHTSSDQVQGEVVEVGEGQQIERAHRRHQHQPQPHTGAGDGGDNSANTAL